MARERDLCDVKIKITEYFDGRELVEQTGQQPPVDDLNAGVGNGGAGANTFFPQPSVSRASQVPVSPWGMQTMDQAMPMVTPAPAPTTSKKFYTLQRVNGNGGNGKGDGVAGGHKHTLEESDKVKKNSVVRWLMKGEKEKRKALVSFAIFYFNFFPIFGFVSCFNTLLGLTISCLFYRILSFSARRADRSWLLHERLKQLAVASWLATAEPLISGCNPNLCQFLPQLCSQLLEHFLKSFLSHIPRCSLKTFPAGTNCPELSYLALNSLSDRICLDLSH